MQDDFDRRIELETRAKAIAAGLDPDAAVAVRAWKDKVATNIRTLERVKDLVRVGAGPFRGRVYEQVPGGGLRRRKDLEHRAG